MLTGDDHGNGGTAGLLQPAEEVRARPAARSPTGSACAARPTSTRTRRSATRRPRRTRATASRSRCTVNTNCAGLHRRPRSTTCYSSQLGAFAREWPSRDAAGHQPHALHRLERLGDRSRRSSARTASASTPTTTTRPGELDAGQAGSVHRLRVPAALRRPRRLDDRRLPGDDADDRRVGQTSSRRRRDRHAARQRARLEGLLRRLHRRTCTPTSRDHRRLDDDRRRGPGARRAGRVGSADARLARRPQRLVVQQHHATAATS